MRWLAVGLVLFGCGGRKPHPPRPSHAQAPLQQWPYSPPPESAPIRDYERNAPTTLGGEFYSPPAEPAAERVEQLAEELDREAPPEPEPPETAKSWWCAAAATNRDELSPCFRDEADCRSFRSASARTGRIRTQPCREQERAACFWYTEILDRQEKMWCHGTFRSCVAWQESSEQNPDHGDVTECAAVE